MHFGLENLARSLLNKTYTLEQSIIQHFKANASTSSGSPSMELFRKSLSNIQEPIGHLVTSSAIPQLNDSYYDYWDELEPSSAATNLSVAANNLTASTTAPVLLGSPFSNNITFHLNQTWVQSSSWADFFLHNYGFFLIPAVFTLFACVSLFKLYQSLKRRKVYHQYSLVYPEDACSF